MILEVIIVDDERLARDRLRRLLEEEVDVEILCECENGRQAVEAIPRHHPDLVFLDVRMPRLDGFEVLDALAGEDSPTVVLVTAHEEYALKAFEIHASDYLLKPVSRRRLRECLARVREERAKKDSPELHSALVDLVEKQRPRSVAVSRIWLRSPGRIISLTRDKILWIDGAGNYVKVHTTEQTYRLRQTLAGLEEMLDSRQFLRIHRSTIVNLDQVAEVAPHSSGELVLVLKNGQRLTVSRSYRKRLRRFHLAAAR